jgi:hypothetical protein
VDPLVSGYGQFVLRWPDGSRDRICWTRRMAKALQQFGIGSDAGLFHEQTDAAGQLVQAMVFEGSYLEPHQPRWRPVRETYVIGGFQ